MTRTENLNLPQWEAADYVQRSDFNDAFASLDEGYSAAMEAAAQVTASLDSKADAATVTADVTALSKQHSSDLTDVQAAMALRGNCQIVIGSYTGTGTYGKTQPNTLKFDKPILILFLTNAAFVKNVYTLVGASNNLGITWNENVLTWYATSSAAVQFNTSGTVYNYVALLDMSN